MLLTDRVSGANIDITFRTLQRSDVGEVIACIRDAYGDSYVKPELYHESALWEEQQSGKLSFTVAEANGGSLAGIIATETSPNFPGLGEIACQIIRREYSGLKLALPLALHQMELTKGQPFCGQFARALGCHLISQKTLTGMGFTHCGFLLSVFRQDKMTTRYERGANPKICQSISAKRQGKQSAALYVPERYLPLAKALYGDLGMPWTLLEEGTAWEESRWEVQEDFLHSTLLLTARRPGTRFSSELSRALCAVVGRPMQTVNLLLNLSCPGSAAAFRDAQRQGFLFTGFLPCCSDGEYMLLHHPLKVPVRMEEVLYIPAFEPYVKEIGR